MKLGIAGGLMVAGLLGVGLFGLIIPSILIILLGLGVAASCTLCEQARSYNSERRGLAQYPEYRY